MNRHGGGPHGSVAITDATTVVVPYDRHRTYLEIQNGGQEGCHLSVSDSLDAVFGSGLYLAPGSVYTVGITNLTPARISAICDAALSTTLFYQIGR
jgi:hypothetical protein